MDSQTLSSSSSSFTLELRLIRARNVFLNSSKEIFLRCYLSTSNKRVRIDSQQIQSNSNSFSWNQTFSLNCSGTPETLKSLKQGTVAFELRYKSSTPLLARLGGSKLLAKVETPWDDVVGVEKWVVMIPKDKYVYSDDVKPPAVEIAMKLVDQEKKDSGRKVYNCGCMDCGCNYCIDYDLFALGEAF